MSCARQVGSSRQFIQAAKEEGLVVKVRGQSLWCIRDIPSVIRLSRV